MIQAKILQTENIEAILAFEKSRLAQTVADESEREFMSWHASWRQESLQHYLPMGWSFGLWNEDTNQLVGYFIAQPQLFLRGMTQTLWVERLSADTPQLAAELVEIAYRVCREKHFQKAVFFQHEDMALQNSIFQMNPISDSLLEIKTAKF